MSSITFKEVPYHVEGKEGSSIGVIVIQEWWGLNDQIKRTTKKYAEKLNALAISPDLYRGKCTTVPDEANHLLSSLDWPGAIRDIQNASEYLRSKGCKKIGIIGFCMGGALSIAASVLKPEFIDAGICFYGVPPLQLSDPANLSIPMQFHFGDLDMAKGFSDKATADALKETLKGKDVEFYQYPDGNHAFMNEEAPAYPYNEKLATIATERALSFFQQKLN